MNRAVSCIQCRSFYSDSRASRKMIRQMEQCSSVTCAVSCSRLRCSERLEEVGTVALTWVWSEPSWGGCVEGLRTGGVGRRRRRRRRRRSGRDFQSHRWGLSRREQLSLSSSWVRSGCGADFSVGTPHRLVERHWMTPSGRAASEMLVHTYSHTPLACFHSSGGRSLSLSL